MIRLRFKAALVTLFVTMLALCNIAGITAPQAAGVAAKPTIVLVHGAFADSSSWSVEIASLEKAGFPVVAFADPLRGIAADTANLEAVLDNIEGPIVLVGHSYAGMVVSQAAAQNSHVVAVVYVAAFIPKVGESANGLISMFPGSELSPDNLHFAKSSDGTTDVFINNDKYGQVYAGGLSDAQIAVAAVIQRPISAAALAEAATAAAPAATPKWMIIATADHAVPTKLQEFMAKRAGATTVEANSGHDVPAAQPKIVTQTIMDAAAATE